MKQSGNIFRKDFQHLRSQLLLPLAALLLFTAIEAENGASGPLTFFSLSALSRGLVLLFCLSWVVVMVNLIQSERLVGLNQFWTTRPYEWPKLMMAKCYFVLLLLYVPLIVSQLILLFSAGLSITHAAPRLLLNLLLFTATIVLPASCAAALTRTTNQAMVILLGMLSVFIAAVAITLSANRLMPTWLIPAQVALAAIILAAALIHQYRCRRTGRAMQMLALAPILVFIAQCTIPGSTLAAASYPGLTQSGSPIAIRFDSDPLRTMPRVAVTDRHARIALHTPLLLSRQQPGSSFSVDAHRVILTGSDGYTWSSPWISVADIIRSAPSMSERTANSEFPISLRAYQRLRGRPVSLRIQFALSQFQDQAPISATLSTAGEMVPKLGVCALDGAYSEIKCRSAFREPLPFAISTVRKDGPCTAADAPTEPASADVGQLSGFSVLPQVNAVVETQLRLTFPTKPSYLCPGLPIQFVERRYERRFQAETPPVFISLNDYISAIQLQ